MQQPLAMEVTICMLIRVMRSRKRGLLNDPVVGSDRLAET